jgi:protein tyrosine/serine phosphatase
MTNVTNRPLPWDACQNARDVGGYPTEDGGVLKQGSLIRSDNLSHLTPVGRAALIDYGIRTIIDVRSPEELNIDPPPFRPPNPEPNAPTYHNLSLAVWTDPAMEIVDQAESADEMYCLMLDHFKPNMATIIRAFAEAPDGGVVVHCHAGKDRTGLILAVLLRVAGVSEAIITADYAESAEHQQPLYDQMVEIAGDNPEKLAMMLPELAAPPERMAVVFAYLKQTYGGVENYLRECGVDTGTLATVRKRLRA